MFYTYKQNNSGGNYIGPHYLIVEANSAKEANRIAEDNGAYFDGEGDCQCCGDRWNMPWGDECGNAEPMIYGQSIRTYKPEYRSRPKMPIKVVYKSGEIYEKNL